MSEKDFFKKPSAQSLIKIEIVEEYFKAWSSIMEKVRSRKTRYKGKPIRYIDLYSGPGVYDDGTLSTPLRILEYAVHNEWVRSRLVSVFNDKEPTHVERLANEIDKCGYSDSLEFPPRLFNEEVNEKYGDIIRVGGDLPTLLFIDPYGYKGLSLYLINSVLNIWGSDVLFFFNYNRFNIDLSNPKIIDETKHFHNFFTDKNLSEIHSKLPHIENKYEREVLIVESMINAIQDNDTGKERYVRQFRFKNDKSDRTSHHLVFISKDKLGYTKMKDIMARKSSYCIHDVPSFEWVPENQVPQMGSQLYDPISDLKISLLTEYSGKRLTVESVIDDHHIRTDYMPRNYKTALKALENEGKIEAIPPFNERRTNTMRDDVLIIFPKE